MKRLLVTIAVVAACGCAGIDGRSIASWLTRRSSCVAVRSLPRNSSSIKASHLRSPHRIRSQHGEIRLLGAEVALAEARDCGRTEGSRRAIPAGDDFNALRARQKYLRAWCTCAGPRTAEPASNPGCRDDHGAGDRRLRRTSKSRAARPACASVAGTRPNND